jgi:hypothetical protein
MFSKTRSATAVPRWEEKYFYRLFAFLSRKNARVGISTWKLFSMAGTLCP